MKTSGSKSPEGQMQTCARPPADARRLAAVPKNIARTTLAILGRLAGGEPAAFSPLFAERSYTGIMMYDDREPFSVSMDPNPVIEAYKEGVDRTLLRENLKLTTGERVEKMIAVLRFAEAVRDSREIGAR